MIFVTVGTHEQSFNRLIKKMDELKKNSFIEDEIVIQTGFSTYRPKYCQWKGMFSYQEMNEYITEARIIITHGGPSSFIMPLNIGKIPIVVPRQSQFKEHVNDHQLDFVRMVANKMGTIIPVENVEELGSIILNYDNLVIGMKNSIRSNNLRFNKEIEKLVDEMF